MGIRPEASYGQGHLLLSHKLYEIRSLSSRISSSYSYYLERTVFKLGGINR